MSHADSQVDKVYRLPHWGLAPTELEEADTVGARLLMRLQTRAER